MTPDQILVIALISFLLVFLPSAGLYGMFKNAGVLPWNGLIPFYNTGVMLQVAKRPMHWFFWQFIPVVGWFITLGIFIEFVKPFGKFKFYQHALTVLASPFYFLYIGYNKKDKFIGVEAVKAYKK